MTGSASEFTEEAGRCITICFTYYSINNYYDRGGEFEGGSGAGIGTGRGGSADDGKRSGVYGRCWTLPHHSLNL